MLNTARENEIKRPKNVFLKTWRPYILIAVIGFLLYFKTLFFDFTFLDDNTLILDHYHILRNLSNVFQIFREDVFRNPYAGAYYRPLLTLSFMFDAQLSGTSLFAYHLTNIIIHLSASCLLFLLLIKLGYERRLALFFSMLFATHPVLTQAVAWVPGRNDSLLALFTLSAFICFLNFLEKNIRKYYLWHLFFFVLALFTKETALMLIPVCLLYLQCIVKEKLFSFNKRIFLIGWIAVVCFWFLLRQSALENNPMVFTISNIGRAFLINSPVVVQLIGKAFLPFNLSVLPIIQDTTFVYGVIGIILLLITLLLSKHKRYNFIALGLSWFALFSIPPLMLHNPALAFGHDYHLEHRIYLPLIGLFIALLETDFIKRISARKYSIILGTSVIFIFCMITFNHSNNFKNRLSLWKNAVKTSPHSPLAHRNLGAIHYLDGELDKAEREYIESLKLNPYEPEAHSNLGLLYMQRGMFEKAEDEYRKELAINPGYDNVHFNLGVLCYKRGNFKEAERLWKKTIEINPNYVAAYHNLVIYYHSEMDFEEVRYYADQLYKKGADISPGLQKIINSSRR